MIKILDLGLKDYALVRTQQIALQQELIAGDPHDYLLICTHPAVITRGKSSKEGQVLASERELQSRKIQVLSVERGGETTYHDPGQLVIYPIFNLNRYRRDVGWYLRQLEEVIILSLKKFGLEGVRIAGKTGVWLNANSSYPDRKIASMGVRISRWCTMHGLAVNVYGANNFNLIVPCGLEGVLMTDLERELASQSIVRKELFSQFQQEMLANFFQVFENPTT